MGCQTARRSEWWTTTCKTAREGQNRMQSAAKERCLQACHWACGLLTQGCVRGVVTTAGLLVLMTGMALAQPVPCPGTATLTLFVDNRSGAPVDIDVDGQLAADA